MNYASAHKEKVCVMDNSSRFFFVFFCCFFCILTCLPEDFPNNTVYDRMQWICYDNTGNVPIKGRHFNILTFGKIFRNGPYDIHRGGLVRAKIFFFGQNRSKIFFFAGPSGRIIFF